MSLEGVARAAGVMEELLFKTPHGLIHQSLRLSLGAETANGGSRTLFASADAHTLPRLHPENQRLQRLADEDRVVVSEPVVDLPGAWDEIPEARVLVVQPGADELRPFRSHLEAGDGNGAQTLDLSTA